MTRCGVCFAVGLPWLAAGTDEAFLPLVLCLLAGWFLGDALVTGIGRVGSRRIALLTHSGIAAVFAVSAWLAVPHMADLPALLRGFTPEWAWGAGIVMGVVSALLPMAGWVWITFVTRLVGLIPTPGGGPSRPPRWRSDPNGVSVEFVAVPMSLRTLAVGIGCVVMFGGAGVAASAIHVVPDRFESPQLFILGAALVIGFALYSVVRVILRSLSRRWELTFGDDGLHMTVNGDAVWLRYDEIDGLSWRSTTEYARMEIVTAGRRTTALVGVARRVPGISPTLPDLPRRVRDLLEARGLSEVRPQRPGIAAYRR